MPVPNLLAMRGERALVGYRFAAIYKLWVIGTSFLGIDSWAESDRNEGLSGIGNR